MSVGADGRERTCTASSCSVPGRLPDLPVRLPDLIWKMSNANSSLYVSTFSVSCMSHLHHVQKVISALLPDQGNAYNGI